MSSTFQCSFFNFLAFFSLEQKKHLHNRLMELQGNIRVFCRVRPVLESEKLSIFDNDVVSYPSDGQIQIIEDKKNGQKPNKRKSVRSTLLFEPRLAGNVAKAQPNKRGYSANLKIFLCFFIFFYPICSRLLYSGKSRYLWRTCIMPF